MSATHLTHAQVGQWYQSEGQQLFLGDVLDASNSKHMGAGFARYKKGTSNDWVVTYDEVLIVTKGVYSIKTEEGTVTAKAGELIFLTKGTKLTYMAPEEDTEVVYVSYPHWADAQEKSEYAHFLQTFHPVSRATVDIE